MNLSGLVTLTFYLLKNNFEKFEKTFDVCITCQVLVISPSSLEHLGCQETVDKTQKSIS